MSSLASSATAQSTSSSQTALTALEAIPAARTAVFKTPLDQAAFWFGHCISMLIKRHSENWFGGITQVASAFSKTLVEGVTEARRLQESGESREAQTILYSLAYDITFLNPSEIRTLAKGLKPGSDLLENRTIVGVFKRAVAISNLPEEKAALGVLVTSYHAKMVQMQEQEAQMTPPVAVEPVAPPEKKDEAKAAVPEPVAVPVSPVDRQGAINAKELPSPSLRQAASAAQQPPLLTAGRIVLDEYRSCLGSDPYTAPDQTNIRALGEHLDTISIMKAQKPLAKLSFMQLLYLYEVSVNHKELLTTLISNSYEAMKDESERQMYRAYLNRYNKAREGVDYDPLLQKIRT